MVLLYNETVDILKFVSVRVRVQLGMGYVVFREDINTGKSTVLAKIPARSPTSPSWVHDFPATLNYVIVPDTPVTVNMGVSSCNICPYL